ncbi:MAG: hypothetical protein WBQ66_20660, partial [Blastocatellia bacterium]
YTMHVKAWETIARQPSQEGLAEIPRPIGFRTLEAKAIRTLDALVAAGYLSPDALQSALREGRSVPVSCFFMELVADADGSDGKDLATHVFSWVLQEHGYTRDDVARLNCAGFSALVTQAVTQLGFEEDSVNVSTDINVSLANSKRLHGFLSRRRFSIDASIIGEVRRTLQILVRSGVFHNDLHARNVMVTGSWDGASGGRPSARAWVIDFGRSSSRPSSTSGSDDTRALEEFGRYARRS